MRYLSLLIVLMVGCHSCPKTPTPMQKRRAQARQRPQDMTDRVLPSEKIPEWLKRNYAQWIRYAYDLEEPDPFK